MALTPEQEAQLLAHLNNNSNPHITTSSQVGLQSTDDLPEGHINLYGDTPDNVKYSATDVSSAGWVVDEDDMSSDSNKKVPTQQSVKKYIEDTSMAQENYITSIGRIMNPLLHLPLKNGFNMPHGKGSVTFTRASSATYIDRYGVVQKVGSDVPRFEKEGLLIEGSNTNILLHSEEIDNGSWSKWNMTISPDVIDAPDGTLTADGIIRNDGQTADSFYSNEYYSSPTISASIFFKAAQYDCIYLSCTAYDADGVAIFAFSNFFKTTGEILDPSTASIDILSNGWCRAKMTCEYTGSLVINHWKFLVRSANSLDSFDYTGDGSTIGVYIWGAQLEEFPHSTSYIPTTSASATRAADICHIDYEGNTPDHLSEQTIICVASDNGPTEFTYHSIVQAFGDIYRMLIIHSGVNYTIRFDSEVLMVPIESSYRNTRTYGMVLKGSETSAYVNGIKKGEKTLSFSGSVIARNKIYIGTAEYSGYRPLYGHVKDLRIYDVALTEEEMKIA